MPRHIHLSRRDLLASAVAGATSLAAPSIVRAQGAGGCAPLKVGVLLPRSGFEASIGQDCQRGVDIAPAPAQPVAMNGTGLRRDYAALFIQRAPVI